MSISPTRATTQNGYLSFHNSLSKIARNAVPLVVVVTLVALPIVMAINEQTNPNDDVCSQVCETDPSKPNRLSVCWAFCKTGAVAFGTALAECKKACDLAAFIPNLNLLPEWVPSAYQACIMTCMTGKGFSGIAARFI